MTRRATLPILLSLAMPGAALAQGHSDQEAGLQITISGAIVSAPAFLGDDDYQTSVFPNISLSYGDRLSASLRGIEYTAFQGESWSAGGLLSYDRGREENPGDSDFMIAGEASTDLIGLGDVEGTFEIGGFVAYEAGPLTAQLEMRQSIDGGHDGLHGEASVSYRGTIETAAMPLFFSVGPRITFADDAYNSAFFDVSAAQSLASGISQYDAGGGINSYGVNASIVMPVSERTSLIGFVEYDQLTGDVGDSSIVQERGSRDQLRAGLFVNYTF